MILTARSLISLQSCPRRFLLESDYDVLRWRPKPLLDASLRRAILGISNGKPSVADAAKDAVADFLQSAANPGLDLPRGTDPYKVAMDYSAMIETILRSVTRWNLPPLAELPPVMFNSSAGWQPAAFTDPVAGELHRIVTVDRWDEAAAARELHGWACFGDLCATGLPMTLHVVEIGQRRAGRQSSPWCRGWRHPTMPNLRMRFARVDGTAFKGWQPVHLADHRDLDRDAWTEQLYREGVATALVRRVPVAVPDPAVVTDTVRQMLMESARGDVLLSERGSGGWRAQPMSRAACDGMMMIPCPFQSACHQTVTDISSLGLYRLRERDKLRVA